MVSEGAGTRTFAEERLDYDTSTVVRGFHSLLSKQIGTRLFASEPPPASLVDILPQVAPRPTLLIWAPNGGNRETMTALPTPDRSSARIWAMDDVLHIKGLQTHPAEYEERVVGFFDEALLGAGAGQA